jgi:hypothetical protein
VCFSRHSYNLINYLLKDNYLSSFEFNMAWRQSLIKLIQLLDYLKYIFVFSHSHILVFELSKIFFFDLLTSYKIKFYSES